AEPALERGTPVTIEARVRNVNRSVGTMLGYEVTRRYKGAGLPDDTIDITLTGTGGQAFGAFVPKGITLRLFGDANDYTGKGLSGGRIIIRPDRTAMLDDSQDVIAGNVIAYGATSGELFLRGQVGERFCVRNSGATAVVEGVGDHALEYMTGGTALILGRTGRNLGAGLSGGTAYVLALRPSRVNPDALASGELTLSPLDAEDEVIVRGLLEQHLEHTESPRARELLSDWPAAAQRFTRVLPAQYARVREALAELELNGGDLTAPGAWAEFLEVTGGSPPRIPQGPSARAAAVPPRSGPPHGLARGQGRARQGPRPAQPSGRPLHGLRHPVLPPGLPAGEPHPRVERPHVARALGRGDRPPACDEQLPGVHRPHLPGPVRDVLRAGHQPARGDDQEHRGLDHRRGLRARPGQAIRAVAPHRQDGRRGRLRPGRA